MDKNKQVLDGLNDSDLEMKMPENSDLSSENGSKQHVLLILIVGVLILGLASFMYWNATSSVGQEQGTATKVESVDVVELAPVAGIDAIEAALTNVDLEGFDEELDAMEAALEAAL
ncbi:MAG: hypothetical protein ACI9VM_000416 [Candidatus Azotimanducaceae bacterium]|jgi:uncharacterized protein HemX